LVPGKGQPFQRKVAVFRFIEEVARTKDVQVQDVLHDALYLLAVAIPPVLIMHVPQKYSTSKLPTPSAFELQGAIANQLRKVDAELSQR
jgi:hypothetical protein